MKLSGTGVALVTPMNEDLSIDYDGLEKVLEHTSAGGVDYWVLCGTTGESATLDSREKAELLDFVRANNPSDLPIVFGIGGNNTNHVIEMIRESDLNEVAAILSVSPYYNKPSQAGIIDHFEAIADLAPVPIILYNVPGRTASNLLAETTVELSRHPNIIGIKEASGMIEQCMTIMKDSDEGFDVISGDDMLTPAIMSMGGVGVISVMANAFPGVFKSLIALARRGHHEKSHLRILDLQHLNPLMYREANPVGIKEVLKQLGLCENYVRLPLVSASRELKTSISESLASIRG